MYYYFYVNEVFQSGWVMINA